MGLAVIVVINTIFYITLFVLTRSLSAKIPTASKYDVLLTRILVLNGISIFAVWTTIVIVVNLAIVLQYSSGLSASTAGTAALTLLAVGVFVYFLLENTVLDKYVRYVLVPYPVVIWGLIGIVAEHWGKPGETRNSVYTLVLLLAMVVLTVIRVVLFFLFRHFRPLKKRPATTDATNLVAV